MQLSSGTRRRVLLGIGVCSVLGASSLAWADDPPAPPAAPAASADSLLKDGDTLMKSGNLADACKAFEGSMQIDKRATTAVRLGECREQNHQLASAVAAYKDALAIPKIDKKSKKTATAKVAALAPKVSTLRLTIPDASLLDGLAVTRGGVPVDAALWNTKLPIDGGEYAIEATAPGHLPYKETATVPNESGEVTVKIPPLDPEPPPPPPPPPPAKVEPAPVKKPEPIAAAPVSEEPSRWSTLTTLTPMRKIALGVAGVGVVSFTIAIVLGEQANDKQDSSHALCPDLGFPCTNAAEANDLNDSARSRALGANIMWTVGAAAVVGAGVMWFLGAPSAEHSGVAIAPSVTSKDAGLALVGRF
jgi:hypothetical protein